MHLHNALLCKYLHDEIGDYAMSGEQDNRISPVVVAARFMEEQERIAGSAVHAGVRSWRGHFWRFNGKYYEQLPRSTISGDVGRFMQQFEACQKQVKKAFVSDVIYNIECMTEIPSIANTPVDLSKLAIDTSGVLTHSNDISYNAVMCMSNGILTIKYDNDTVQTNIYPHSPSLFITQGMSYAYDPSATCPMWRAFLSKVLPDIGSQATLQEYTGLLLVPELKFQKFLILIGEGSNGKSTFLTVLKYLLGTQNVSHVSLQQLGEKFGRAPLEGKLANIAPDLADVTNSSSGYLKAIVGGDPVSIERKFQEQRQVLLMTRFVFAANQAPRLTDRSDGLWRKAIVVPFPVKILEAEQDSDLAAKLAEELPGIFNWALEGLNRLVARGKFLIPEVCELERNQMRETNNPVRIFLRDSFIEDPNGRILTVDLYERYVIWAKANRFPVMNTIEFGKEIRRVFPTCMNKSCMVNKQRYKYYVGIREMTEPEIADTVLQENNDTPARGLEHQPDETI